jgi:hypothetical protein
MNSVETHQSGVASGVNNAVSRVAGLLGIAVMSIMIVSAFNSALDERLASLDLPSDVQAVVEQERANLAGAQVVVGSDAGVQAALDRAFKEAYLSGFRLVMLFAAGLALAGAVTAWAMIEGKEEPRSLQRKGVARRLN